MRQGARHLVEVDAPAGVQGGREVTKRVVRATTVVLGGHDISDRVVSWVIHGVVGDTYMVDLVVLDDGTVVIEEPEWFTGKLRVAGGTAAGRHSSPRKILVNGTDISSIVRGYERVTEVGEVDAVRLHLYADSDFLTINGSQIWDWDDRDRRAAQEA